MYNNKIVITGIGPVTPIGTGVEKFWKACCEGRSGIRPFGQGDNNHRPDIGVVGRIDNFNPVDFVPKAKAKWMDRFAHIGISATKLALDDAGIDLQKQDTRKIGVFCGSCLGGMLVAEEQLEILYSKGPKRVRPKLVPANTLNSAAGEIAIAFGLKGPNLSVSNAFVGGAETLGLAYDAFQLYDLDVMVVGGVDAPLGNITIRSLLGSHSFSKTDSKPFDLNRDGPVLSEGGAVMIMEKSVPARQRGAHSYAEYAGYGHTRGHAPRNAKALLEAGRFALRSAGLTPENIDYIHAFGSATEKGDKIETQAIKDLLGKRAYQIPISSVKSMIGYTFGGAAAIDIAVGALSLSSNKIIPTINYQTPDPTCDLDFVPNSCREANLEAVLVNAMGLNGDSIATALKKVHT